MKQFIGSLGISAAWVSVSAYFALPWFSDITNTLGVILAALVVLGIALIPGFAMSFVYGTVLIDRRHKKTDIHTVREVEKVADGITILVAAYNEQDTIHDTLGGICLASLNYTGPIEVIVCNDGSVDETANRVTSFIASYKNTCEASRSLKLLNLPKNVGKSTALNLGLKKASHDIIVTVDADTRLQPYSLQCIAHTLKNSDEDVAAVAGTVLVKNRRRSWITRLQSWDYLIGISAVKHAQSAYQYTLVAQGAFSAYYKKVLEEVGGWPNKYGEDIVLSWKLLRAGYRITHDQNAIAFTSVPETYRTFFRQRKRWSIGLIESFKETPGILLNRDKGNVFVYYNALFPFLDLVFLFAFIPSVILAIFFQYYLLVGVLTLLLIPLGATLIGVMYQRQRTIFKRNGMEMAGKNASGLLLYVFLFQVLQVPATLTGYAVGLFNLKTTWGEKK